MSERLENGVIIVPFKGNTSDEEVMRQACLLARRSQATIYAVYVVVVPQELAIETEMANEINNGETALGLACKIANEYGVDIETSILQARSAGVALVEEANERQADMIMMSVTYRSRRGEFNMGNTVPYILKNAKCRVWMCRSTHKDNE